MTKKYVPVLSAREMNHLQRLFFVDQYMLENDTNVKDFKMYVCECP